MDDRPDVPLRADLMAALRRHAPQLGRGTDAGLFIVFEGGEGAGKSTQVRRLADALTAKGLDVVVTFEPGATAIGAKLREILLASESAGLTPQAEALLYAADRAQHVAEVIRPALSRGAVVISDRYIDSSLAYQAGGRALADSDVRRLSVWATGALIPDLTILLDIAPEVGLSRRGGPGDRLEAESIDFHRRVRAAFLDLADHDRGRYLVLDAAAEPDQVHRRIVKRVNELLPMMSGSRLRGIARSLAGARQ
jgi:dTMP kinase